MGSDELSLQVQQCVKIFASSKRNQFRNPSDIIDSLNAQYNNPENKIENIIDHVKLGIKERRGLEVLSAIAPLTDAIGNGPDAFAKAASGGRGSLSATAKALFSVCQFANVALSMLTNFGFEPAAKPTDFSPELIYRVLYCTRIMDTFPAQLDKLRTMETTPYNEDITGPIVTNVVNFALTYIKVLNLFLQHCVPDILASPAHKRKLEPLLNSSLNLSFVASLLGATGEIFNGFINLESSLPYVPDEQSLKTYALALSQASALSKSAGAESSTLFRARVMSTGAWVTPYFTGIEQYINECEEGKLDINESTFFFLQTIEVLTSAIQSLPNRPDWHTCANTVRVMANPKFRKVAMEVLHRFEKLLRFAKELDEKGKCELIIVPLVGYAVLLDATCFDAQVNNIVHDWTVVANILTNLGNSWLQFAAVSAAAQKLYVLGAAGMVDRTFCRVMSVIKTNWDGHSQQVVSENVIPMLCAVDRLLSIAATGPNFLSSIGTKGLNLPMEFAYQLSGFLAQSAENRTKVADEVSPAWCIAAGAAALEALQTGCKAAMVLATMPLELRKIMLTEEYENTKQGIKFGEYQKDTYWFIELTLVIEPLLNIISVAKAKGGLEGRRQAACAVLTVADLWRCLGPLHDHAAAQAFISYNILQAQCFEDLIPCVVPSDLFGLKVVHENLETRVKNGIDLVSSLCWLAENADPLDPGRMKQRALILGHRICGYLRCTALRPSLDKPFGQVCAGCETVRYCCVEHQKKDWKKVHKIGCKELHKAST